MEMQQGHAEWTCSIDMQRVHRYGAWTYKIDIQHRHTALRIGNAAWTSSEDKQQEHAACSM
jgi:hypothetical protein